MPGLRVLWLGLTYAAHPVCCAAGLEVLNIYEEDHLIENTAIRGRHIEEEVKKLEQIHTCIVNFRNTGLLGCIELVKNRTTREPLAPFNATHEEMMVMNKVAAKIKELGMYTFVRWNYIFIAPPLCITEEEVNKGLAIISEALKIADAHTSV